MSAGGERVSVIVCTKDRREDLARALASIAASAPEARAAQIVVVEETDAPRPVPGTTYVAIPRAGRGFGYARNRGVAAAGGDILVFIDDDCEAGAGWLPALLAPLRADPAVAGVAGSVLVRDTTPIGYAENILGFPGGGLRYLDAAGGRVVPTRHLSTCNCAYRREAIRRAGGFLEDARLGSEDTLLAERVVALGPCAYAPDAVVYHRPRGRLSAIFRWFMRRGRAEIGLLRATRQRPAVVGYLVRSSWTLRLVALAALLAAAPRLLVLLPAAVALWLAVVLWRFRFALRYPRHRAAWWLVPAVKLTMDLGAEAGRWRALLRGGR